MKNVTLKRLFILIIAFIFSVGAYAQSISGVVNSYTTVSVVSGSSITVGSSASLAVNDPVMIIQMTGISGGGNAGGIDNGAGNYHVAKITSISGNNITIDSPVTKVFSPNTEKVQLVKIAKYVNDVTVVGTVSAQPWNGSTGGVVFIDACDNNITLNANINASGDGFFGRNTTGTTSAVACGESAALVNTLDENWGTDSVYFGSSYSNPAPLSGGTGRGGHGGCDAGQGSPDGGAGVGGNGANSTSATLGSGGGGGGYGGGGTSGGNGALVAGTAAPIVGNVFDSANTLRLFMGASGGSEAEWAPATGNGGGIVIVLCNNLTTDGLNRNIISDGDDGPNSGSFAFNGSVSRVTGGAGGAGYIVINANNISTQARAFARGGDGTVQTTLNPTFIEYGGPGGGGFIISSSPVTTTSVVKGNILAGNGARAGADGKVVVDSAIEDSFTVSCLNCNLVDAGKTSETCVDNGTANDASDDYISFSLNPTGVDLGSTYNVTVNGGATVIPTSGNYGSATLFRLQNGSANSNLYTLTITDATSGTCSIVTNIQQASCSSLVACDASASGNLDTDGDNVSDICDLDDDNDGILDVNEGACGSHVLSGAWVIAGNTASYDFGNGVIAEVSTSNAIDFTAGNFTNDSFWTENLANATSLQNQYIWGSTLTVNYVDALGNPVTVTNPIIHLDRLGGTDGVTTQNGAIVTLLNGLTWNELTGTSDFNVASSTASDTGINAPANPAHTQESTQNDSDGTAAGTVQINGEISTFTLQFVQGGLFGTGTDGIELILSACQSLDTDNDSTPDYLDNDSDGDGCPDSIEGGDNIDIANVDISTGQLIGTVDSTTGVPNDVDVFSGQTLGNSANDEINACLGSVSGTVVDENGDPVSGVVVTLDDGDVATVDPTVTTGVDGTYEFTDVPVGDYTIVETIPANTDVVDGDTTDDGDTVANTDTTDGSIPVTVTAGEVDADNNFENSPIVGDLTGVVFEDIDGDGIQDAGEEGIEGVDIVITDVDGNETTVTTGIDGIWAATDIPIGDTEVDVDETTLPTDITDTLTTTDSDPEIVTVLEGVATVTIDDGYAPVDIDSDGDGVLDSVEVANGTDPNNECNYNIADITEEITAITDCDNDGLTDAEEITGVDDPLTPADPAGNTTDPTDPDTDGDGVTDGQEALDGTDPNNSCEYLESSITLPQDEVYLAADCDGDGVTNGQEVIDGTDALDPCDYLAGNQDITIVSEEWEALDCDGDGVINGTEILDSTDPQNPCDFIAASTTVAQSTEWLNGDCDNDNVPNGVEQSEGDTDGDSIPDYLDTDDDGDGVDTINEDYGNTDFEDGDIDPTGDNDPTNDDTDGDSIPDYLDTDDDNDGIPTEDEYPDPDNNGIGFGDDAVDSDGDGLPDYLDVNNASPQEDDLEIFNAVTPNGDGDNDVFIIRNIELYPENTVKIYNRWGVIVYETSSYGSVGNYFNGRSNGRVTIQEDELLPVGTYFYVVEYTVEGETKSRAGYLYLQR